uniref:Secreted protein n=1 Tax=Ixodes ricinus TaxID=34613 RepID=A0A147BBC0_IXORI
MRRNPLHPCFLLTLLTFFACLQLLSYFSNLDSLVPKSHAMACARHASVSSATMTVVARTPSTCALDVFFYFLSMSENR